MSQYIPNEIIDEIQERANIVDILNTYITLKKVGSTWKACCPFHNEKTPSFVVTPSKGIYHCFGCGEGGNIFRFLMNHEGMTFVEAVKQIAGQVGVVIPETTRNLSPEKQAEYKKKKSQKDKMFEIHKEVAEFYNKGLINYPNTPIAQYLQQRGIPLDIQKKFQLGVSPDSWSAILDWGKDKNYKEKDILEAGLAIKNEEKDRVYDRFRNRLMFPIWDEKGAVIAFSARTIEKDAKGAKYVNSPETPIFIKSKVLYALCLAKKAIQKTEFAILCEGQLDVIAMHRAGFENSVSSQGTAFCEKQAFMLKRYTTKVYVGFDGDAPGQKSTVRAIDELLKVGLQVKVIEFPEGKDPDDLYKNQGVEIIENLVSQAIDFSDFLIKYYSTKFDISDPFGKISIVENATKHLAHIKDKLPREEHYAQLADKFKIDENELFKIANKEREQQYVIEERSNNHKQIKKETLPLQQNIPLDNRARIIHISPKILDAEKKLLKLSLSHGTVGHRLAEELPHSMITHTIIGHALENVILMTTLGEWEFAEKRLLKAFENESPPKELFEVLSDTTEYEHEKQEKIIDDCIMTIIDENLNEEIKQLMIQLRTAENEELKENYRQQYVKKREELILFRKTHKQHEYSK